MRKLLLLAITLIMCTFSMGALAAENAEQAPKEAAVSTTQHSEYPAENYCGEITYGEMDEMLKQGEGETRVFLKTGEDNVLVFDKVGEDDSICKQIVLATPEETMIQVYSNDKQAFNRMYKAARSISKKAVILNGHNLVVEKGEAVKVSDNASIYKFWMKKFYVESNPQTVKVKRRGFSLPIGIGIGIGHHGHGRIGIGL